MNTRIRVANKTHTSPYRVLHLNRVLRNVYFQYNLVNFFISVVTYNKLKGRSKTKFCSIRHAIVLSRSTERRSNNKLDMQTVTDTSV